MNPKKSNSGFLVVLLILVIGAYYFISVFQPGSGDYTYQQFMKDVKSDKVTAVTIKQNKEVPTGTITAEFGKDDYKSCEVTDVNQSVHQSHKLRIPHGRGSQSDSLPRHVFFILWAAFCRFILGCSKNTSCPLLLS